MKNFSIVLFLLFFTASGYDLNLPLEKVDDDNLQGKLMNMFESTAVRIK